MIAVGAVLIEFDTDGTGLETPNEAEEPEVVEEESR